MIFESIFIGEFSKGKIRTIGTESLSLAKPKLAAPKEKMVDEKNTTEGNHTEMIAENSIVPETAFMDEDSEFSKGVDDLGCPNQEFTKLFDSYFLYNMDKLDHESSLLQKKKMTAITTIKHHNVKDIRKAS